MSGTPKSSSEGAVPKYDAIVIGSGISGGWAAKELTERGLRVQMPDRGRMVRHREDYPTEHVPAYEFKFRGLGDKRNFDLHNPGMFGPNSEASGHFFARTDKHPYTTAPNRPFEWIRGDQVGGKSLVWARQSYRYAPTNFEENALDGHGLDWPIRYADIEPWYDKVEQFIGISGERLEHPMAPGGKYFQPGMPLNPIERDMQARMAKAFPERPLTIARVANLTKDLGDERAACHYCGPCERGCSTGSYFSTQSSTLPAAMATGRLTVMSDSIVTRILTDDTGRRATGVEVMDAKSREKRTHGAGLVFVCASAFESLRLLLLSANAKHPNGLANSSGLLGKYVMDHFSSDMAVAAVPAPDLPAIWGGRPAAMWMPRYRNVGGDRQVSYKRGFQVNAVVFPDGWQRGSRTPGIGINFKKRLKKPELVTILMGAQCEMMPDEANRVTIDPEIKDAWGIPVVRIDIGLTANDWAMHKAAGDDMNAMLSAMGYQGVTRLPNQPVPGRAIHEMGGAPMGNDPKKAVLDAHNRAHDIRNLFVTDGAAMNSSSQSNPSITYMALTARAADFAAREYRAGRL